jgi:ribosomal protein S18 acetylase RimI-like enzyme
VADGTVGIYNVATLREARGLGLGGALTRYAIAEGRRRGATVAILQASAMGRHLYETIGFREVLRFRVFAETPEGTSR